MKVRALKQIKGYAPGATLDLNDETARALISAGVAARIDDHVVQPNDLRLELPILNHSAAEIVTR